jgi:hypothetical protein
MNLRDLSEPARKARDMTVAKCVHSFHFPLDFF